MEDEIRELIVDFLSEVSNGNVEIYNEFSLQHELGLFLRNNLFEGHPQIKVQFERNIDFFGINNEEKIQDGLHAYHFNGNYYPKKEIDIVILDDEIRICAIELKYPKNGQYPQQMYKFCEDISFCEILVNNGNFQSAFTLVLADNKKFYRQINEQNNSPYIFFREGGNQAELCCEITNNYQERKYVLQNYGKIIWTTLIENNDSDDLKYFLIEIQAQ